jgi:sugar O-acyltransferase (sialic acid O-acetyltransferase NeuD family)
VNRDGIGLLGAGRQALEAAGYCRDEGLRPLFFLEEQPPDYERDENEYGAGIITFEDDLEELLEVPVLAAVGMPATRRRLVRRWSGRSYRSLVSARAWVAEDCTIGEGCLIAPMAAVNRVCRLGEHVMVNVGAILSHDVQVGDYSVLSPGCTIGGRVSIGEGVFLGIGSSVRDRVTIGDGAFVAAGAVVINDVEQGQLVMGVPALPQQGREVP